MVAGFSSCQVKDESGKVITVVGQSVVAIQPDVGILQFTITDNNPNFGKAIVGLNEKTSRVNHDLLNIGYDKQKIKTTNFTVDNDYHELR